MSLKSFKVIKTGLPLAYCTRNDMRAFAIFGLREIVYFGMSPVPKEKLLMHDMLMHDSESLPESWETWIRLPRGINI